MSSGFAGPVLRDEDRLAGTGARLPFDPVVLLVAGVALVVYLAHGLTGPLKTDTGLYAYAGQQVADGVPPYLGVLNRAGPLAHWLPGLGAVGARLVGIDDLVGIRLLYLLFSVVTVGVVYLLGRDLFGSRVVGLVSAASFLSFTGFVHYATYGPRDKTPVVMFLALALWAVTRQRWLWSGVWLGLATLTIQIALFFGAPALLVAALVGNRGWPARLTALLRIGLGGLATLAATAGYFLLAGAFDDFLDGYLRINAEYTHGSPMADELGPGWHRMVAGYDWSIVVLVVGLVAVFPLAWWALRRGSDAPPAGPMAGIAAGVLGGGLWTLIGDFDTWPDAFPLLPFAALGVGGCLHVLAGHLPTRGTVAVAVVWSLLATGYAVGYAVSDRSDALDQQRAAVRASLAVVGQGATIASVEAPQALVLSGKTNPTRLQMFGGGFTTYVDDTWPGGIEGYRRSLLDDAPTLIALRKNVRQEWIDAIEPDYARVGCAPWFRLYARRDLGSQEVARLERRLGGCPGARR